ncbi:deoxyribose-phosphate aldolase [Brachyspira sp.]|uniref:deoxyribose-phosphate aldolase n=1 Tax=Brachyspira sp. TaxID=1977261 RepID=UPI003D7CF176
MQNINQLIDHTILKPEASIDDIRKLCIEAKEYNFYSVCVNSAYVNVAYNFLLHSDVKVCSVVGFPLGAMIKEAKAYEAKFAVDSGAEEIDMVINIGLLKSGKIDLFERDIKKVREACKASVLKVIIETCLLDDKEKILACKIAKEYGADFVKTSTGFSTGGATEHDVELMRKTVGDKMGVKASGGIKTYEDAIKMINAGANRLGTSSGIAIMKSVKEN